MGMGRSLGRLMAFANPLDQSAVQQILKSQSGKGIFAKGLALASAGAKQITSGGYWQGRNLRAVRGKLRSLSGGNVGGEVMSNMRSKAGYQMRSRARKMNREIGGQRKMLAGGVGAFLGLNVMAPDSGLTNTANMVVGAGAFVGAAKFGVGAKWGRNAEVGMYAAGGAALGAKMMGII